MRTASLIIKELAHRKAQAALAIVAVAAAVAICVAMTILDDASVRETGRIQRDIGFNLRIIPRDTDMQRFYLTGYSDQTFDAGAVRTLASRRTLAYNHVTAMLSKRILLEGGVEAVLTGIADPLYPPGQKKPPMVTTVPTGSVHLGAELATRLRLTRGDAIDLNGEPFTIERVGPRAGTTDDVRITTNLADAQRVLGEPGRINEIAALDCLCVEQSANPREAIAAEVEEAIPGAQVVMLSAIADARARQRRMAEDYTAVVTPITLIAAGICVAALAMINVHQRSAEIGVMRALGYPSSTVLALLLGRAAVIGAVGAIAGYVAGSLLAIVVGPQVFRITANAIDAQPMLVLWALAAAAVGAVIASFIPAAFAVAQDPAATLRED